MKDTTIPDGRMYEVAWFVPDQDPKAIFLAAMLTAATRQAGGEWCDDLLLPPVSITTDMGDFNCTAGVVTAPYAIIVLEQLGDEHDEEQLYWLLREDTDGRWYAASRVLALTRAAMDADAAPWSFSRVYTFVGLTIRNNLFDYTTPIGPINDND